MPNAELPEDEDTRLAALRSLRILDTGPEEAFEQIVSVARTVFQVPIVFISLVDEDRQWFKARIGVEARETPRGHSICAHAILGDDPLVIPDTTLDPRTRDNPLVTGEMGIRFYGGAPLIGESGHRYGTFCVIDRAPRAFGDAQMAELKGFAAVTVQLLHYRKDAQFIQSERGRAERNERRLRDAIEALPEGFALYDKDDRLVLFNQTYTELYADSAPAIRPGATFEDVIRYGADRNQYPEALDHPGGVDGWVADRIAAHRSPSEPIEQKLTGGRWLRIQETKTHADEIVGFRVDISWQKRVSESLRRLQQMSSSDQLSYRTKRISLLELGREVMDFDVGVVWDVRDGEIEVAAVLGDMAEHLEIRLGDRSSCASNPISELAMSGEPVSYPDLGGLTTTFAGSAKSLLAAPVVLDGKTIAILGFFQVSQRVNLNASHRDLISIMADWLGIEVRRSRALAALREAKEEAEQASRSKSRFLAMMSHELRTPMNGVIGLVDLMLNSDVNEEQTGMLDLAKHSAESLLVILNDILDFSKLEAGRLELEAVTFDLPSVIKDVVGLLGTQASARGLRVFTVLEKNLPIERVGDPTRLRQILMNLVGNAIKFTKTGGVTIRVGTAPDTSGESLMVQVTDTGIGIPEERQGALFQEFSQLDSSVARQFGGTGLGLAICKRLVEMMEGDIWLDRTGPDGTCFAFKLPLPSTRDGGAPKTLLKRIAVVSDMSVLVVDESPLARDTVRRQLEVWGLQAVAVSPAAVFQTLNDHTPDTLLVLSGNEPVQVADMAALARTQGVRVLVALTRSLGERTQAPESADAVLIEPLDPVRLLLALGAGREGSELLDASAALTDKPAPSNQLFRSERRLNVLVAEDNPVNQALMIRALERMGHGVTIVSNGLEAYDTCRGGSFDVVLMDIEMPEMDGMEAVRWIRERMEDQTPPMIAMTAHAFEGSRKWLIDSGFDDYLSKPLKLSELQALLNGIADTPEALDAPIAGALSAGGSDTAPLIDDARLGELLTVLPKEVFAEMSEQFLDSTDAYIATLGEAISSDNAEATRQTAHAIKGVALNFGATALADLAHSIESEVRESGVLGIRETFSQLKDAATETRVHLLTKIQSL
ncbi:MAG: ATP-binding protein [Alphaproteobacteria bacterium]|nr:ATP-binding protein [Alphaproteobacteria bacterium]